MEGDTMESEQNLVAFLTDQHEQMKKLMTQVLDAEGTKRQERFTQVRRTLAVHEALEQETVHPAAQAEIGSGVARARIQEESEAGSVIAGLEALDPDSAAFGERYTGLLTSVIAHAERA